MSPHRSLWKHRFRQRRLGRPGTLLAAALLVLALPTPAHAAGEGGWWNPDPWGRSKATPQALQYNGRIQYLVLGNDNGLWWRSDRNNTGGNAGSWWAVGAGTARSDFAPSIQEWRGQVWIFHTGRNNTVYYARLIDESIGSWTAWTAIPGSEDIVNGVDTTVLHNQLYVYGTDLDGGIVWQRLNNPGGTWNPGWTGLPGSERAVGAVDATSFPVGSVGNEHTMIAHRGTDDSVYTTFTDDKGPPSREDSGSSVEWNKPGENNQEDPGSPRWTGDSPDARATVTAARVTSTPRVTDLPTENPNDGNQSQMVMTTRGLDGHTWYSVSYDGGYTWDAFRHTDDGPSPTLNGPAPFTVDNEPYMAARWNGDPNRFPTNSVVVKKLPTSR